MGDKYIIPNLKEKIKSSYKDINLFLIKTCLRKNITHNINNKQSMDGVFEKIVPTLRVLPEKIVTQNVLIQLSNVELLEEAFLSIMTEDIYNEKDSPSRQMIKKKAIN